MDAGWEQGNWHERLLGLPGLSDEQKGEANTIILRMDPAGRETAVPKKQAVAIASIMSLLHAGTRIITASDK